MIPQNSQWFCDSEKGINPAITEHECKVEFTSMISQMTCIQNQIVNHSLDSPAHNRALKNGHIIFFWVIHLECLPNRFIIISIDKVLRSAHQYQIP